METNNNKLNIKSIDERLSKIMDILKNNKYKSNTVFVYIIYDITDNKIRNHVAKYLERNGLVRVQLSVFFGDIKRNEYHKIKATLKQINDMYENKDSVFIIPIGEDILNKTTIIGKNVDFEIITNTKSTLFI